MTKPLPPHLAEIMRTAEARIPCSLTRAEIQAFIDHDRGKPPAPVLEIPHDRV